jgi:hypothetical protein
MPGFRAIIALHREIIGVNREIMTLDWENIGC